MLPKKSIIVFISSLEGDLTIPDGVKQLIALGYNIIVLSPSSIDIEYSMQTIDANNELAHRILSFERENYISQIRNSGARVVEWDPTQPLAVSLEEVGKYQIRR
jgi:hypothetical protein